jgi:hypothetical protein
MQMHQSIQRLTNVRAARSRRTGEQAGLPLARFTGLLAIICRDVHTIIATKAGRTTGLLHRALLAVTIPPVVLPASFLNAKVQLLHVKQLSKYAGGAKKCLLSVGSNSGGALQN